MSKLMTFKHKGYRFEKYENGATVNVYDERTNENIHCFTHYEIGKSKTKLKESCIETYNEMHE